MKHFAKFKHSDFLLLHLKISLTLSNMKKSLLSIVCIITVAFSYGQCSEIFISEYVEGWGNNKAIELYNPTSAAKNLSDYRLERYSNGSSSAAANQRLVLSGIIEPYSTFVIVIDKRNPDGTGQEQPVWNGLQEKADLFACPNYDENNAMYFNGNDAMVLRNLTIGVNGFVVDVFGRIGEDPGEPNLGGGWNNVAPAFTWLANGAVAWSTDHSLIRKPNIEIGDFIGTDLFDPSVQYDSIPPVTTGPEGNVTGGNWASLGSHECVCNPLSTQNAEKIDARLYPNPAHSNGLITFISEKEMVRYEIFDLTGKLVKAENVQNLRQFEIKASGMTNGIYFFRAFDGHAFYTQKLILN